MKKKEILITLFLVSFLLILSTGIFFCYSFVSNKENENNLEKIEKDDPLISEVMNLVTKTTLLREPNYFHKEVKEETKIRYIYSMLKEEDATWVKIKPKKIVCEVTNKVSFISSTPCIVQIIPNHVFKKYETLYFQTNKEFIYPDIMIYGNKCINDGENYYCLKGEYFETRKTFSLIEKVYRKEETLIIYEYYVNIDTTTINDCLNFFSKTYCQEYENPAIYQLKEEDIKRNGVLYKHTFQKMEDFYFLESSIVV